MTLTKYEQPVSLAEMIDDVLGTGYFRNNSTGNLHYPEVDIVENKETFVIKADLPGLTKENIEIKVENGVLTIAGEKKQGVEKTEQDRYYHFERSYGRFSRSFNLPDNVHTETIAAKFEHGVLEVTLQKKEEVKPKAIEVKIS